MEYAIQLILPIIGGLMLGNWLSEKYGLSPIWTVLLGILGLVAGIAILYKRTVMEQKERPPIHISPKPPSKKQSQQETKPSHKPSSSASLQTLDELYQKLHNDKPGDETNRDYDHPYKDEEHDQDSEPHDQPKPTDK